MKKVLRFLLYSLAFIVIAILIFLLISVTPLDRTPAHEKSFYGAMMSRLDSLASIHPQTPTKAFAVGYGKVNLTPPFPTATAGYGKRRGQHFSAVHDSIYVRSMVIDNGVQRVAIVSADLLIIPPTVTAILEKELPAIGFSVNNTYLGATHTHNSIGNWGEGATRFIYGAYSEDVVRFIVDRIKESIVKANNARVASVITSGTIPLREAVWHRIDEEHGKVDSLLRVIEVHREDSAKLIFVSYTAHATCLYSKDLQLSRDYPGEVVDKLEQHGYDFAMFMAGAVGSHGCKPPEYGYACIDWMSDTIVRKITANHDHAFTNVSDTSLLMIRIPLALGEPQVKITNDWRIRPWLFKYAFGEYQPYLTGLRIGNLMLLGTPCDYAGELTAPLDSAAAAHQAHAMVTSFNGHYIGYITADKYYDHQHYETQLMNWYGPGNGAYMTECLIKVINGLAD